MVGQKKERLDRLVVERGLSPSRERARAMIMAGQVVVNDERIDKAGTQVPLDAEIRLKGKPLPYVSRGGLKLEAALDAFALDPTGSLALDLGASTGGFTDCLLQRGARRVIAVDVGQRQLHQRLRADPRVQSLEGENARYLVREQLPLNPDEKIEWIVADLSFISLKLILEPLAHLLDPAGDALLLVKPQFEAGRERVGKGGVVRDEGVRQQCADGIRNAAAEWGLAEQGRLDSPLAGPKGNVEILLWLRFAP